MKRGTKPGTIRDPYNQPKGRKRCGGYKCDTRAEYEIKVAPFGKLSGKGTPKKPQTLYLCEDCYELEQKQVAMMYGVTGDERRCGSVVRV